ncbi:cyclin-dependent kinase 1-A-like [Dermacentor albipictus]|uniref:cyclin-dependent kinase 1-A-like n=1 Tax=Dermacentor albipictus TaxID=60249 RepID=UPI0031FCCA4B
MPAYAWRWRAFREQRMRAVGQSRAATRLVQTIPGDRLPRILQLPRPRTFVPLQSSRRRIEAGLDSMDNYVMMEKIGEGTYGVVYKARCKRSNKTVAMKKVRVENADEGVPSTTIREVTLLKELTHENIVRLVDVVMPGSNSAMYLVFEYMAMDLRKRLDTLPKDKKLDAAVVKKYVRQILDAIVYCHQRRVLHRDLKPANLLIDQGDTIKVADFGLCRALTLTARPYTHEVVTLWYRAPEVIMGTRRYSTPVDVWSIGCIFFELATGKVLFRGESEIEQLFRIFRVLGTPTDETWPHVAQLPNYKPNFPFWKASVLSELLPEVDGDAVDLLEKMLRYVPGKRISARDALAHPYFAGSSASKQADAELKVD